MTEPLKLEDPDKLLAEMAADGQEPAPVLGVPALGVYGKELTPGTRHEQGRIVAQAERGGPIRGIKRVRYSHADCIDRILASPGIAQNDLAMIYGVTPAWMSIVMNSDAFKVAFAERKAELVDPVLATTLNERFGALAARSVEVLLEKMNQPAAQISDKLALEAASLGARSVGLGSEVPGAKANAADHLAAIAHRLIDLNRPTPPTIEGEVRAIN